MGVYGILWVKIFNFDWVVEYGLLFQQVYILNVKCLFFRVIIFIGWNSWQLEEVVNYVFFFFVKYKIFFEVLKEQGYFIGYVVKGYVFGNLGMVDGKFRELVGLVFNKSKIILFIKVIGVFDYVDNFKFFFQ